MFVLFFCLDALVFILLRGRSLVLNILAVVNCSYRSQRRRRSIFYFFLQKRLRLVDEGERRCLGLKRLLSCKFTTIVVIRFMFVVETFT
jgi:hypothetical protein